VTKVKIRHGLAYYLDETGDGDKPVQRTAFRGQTIKVSETEATRLKKSGAAVDADEELPMLGRITPIPNTASDEELLAWASVATKDEVARAISEKPALGDRIRAAHETIQERLKAQDEFLSGLEPTIKDAQKAAKRRPKATGKNSAPTTGSSGVNVTHTKVDDEEEDLDELEEEEDDGEIDDPAEVVKNNVDAISKHLSEHPDQAVAVMEAENALAAEHNRQPRDGVIRAVQAAANANSGH
jgi:hypothetical protein